TPPPVEEPTNETSPTEDTPPPVEEPTNETSPTEDTPPPVEEPTNETSPTEDTPPPSQLEPDATNWQDFTSTQGSFTVSLPGNPTEEIEPADPARGMLETGSYVWESEADEIAYGVFYKVLPIAPTTEQISGFLDSFRDDFVSEAFIDGQLIAERPIDIESYPGREIAVEGSDGYVEARVYLVNERLYLLVAIAPNQTDFPQGGDRFLDSFQLISD
ncbi:MAG: hypothetical protein SW833_28480, partial [Cyanobacteriota bacterium]|nr:hypothetical protein [Cyanobacteriota bacterium]